VRKGVVIACLIAVTQIGCATQPVAFVPAGVDHVELAAAIARQGRESAHVEVVRPTPEPNPPPEWLVKTGEVAGITAFWTARICGAILLSALVAAARGGFH